MLKIKYIIEVKDEWVQEKKQIVKTALEMMLEGFSEEEVTIKVIEV